MDIQWLLDGEKLQLYLRCVVRTSCLYSFLTPQALSIEAIICNSIEIIRKNYHSIQRCQFIGGFFERSQLLLRI